MWKTLGFYRFRIEKQIRWVYQTKFDARACRRLVSLGSYCSLQNARSTKVEGWSKHENEPYFDHAVTFTIDFLGFIDELFEILELIEGGL